MRSRADQRQRRGWPDGDRSDAVAGGDLGEPVALVCEEERMGRVREGVDRVRLDPVCWSGGPVRLGHLGSVQFGYPIFLRKEFFKSKVRHKRIFRNDLKINTCSNKSNKNTRVLRKIFSTT